MKRLEMSFKLNFRKRKIFYVRKQETSMVRTCMAQQLQGIEEDEDNEQIDAKEEVGKIKSLIRLLMAQTI
jgi:hypothetical protein